MRSNAKEALKCPRCDSINTKFCYYNNYNKSQPRHFCKNCKRYWTDGGTLRNVPIGGGHKKSMKTRTSYKKKKKKDRIEEKIEFGFSNSSSSNDFKSSSVDFDFDGDMNMNNPRMIMPVLTTKCWNLDDFDMFIWPDFGLFSDDFDVT